jgi:hypothetical protein
MSTIPYQAPALDEAIGNAWIAKPGRQEKAAMRAMGIALVIALSLAAIAFVIYRFAL